MHLEGKLVGELQPESLEHPSYIQYHAYCDESAFTAADIVLKECVNPEKLKRAFASLAEICT